MSLRAVFGHGADKRDRGAPRRNEIQLAASSDGRSDLAVVPELVLPGKHPLDRPEAFFENGRLEDRLAAPLRLLSAARIGVDVGNHAAVEDRLAVDPAIVDAIEADDGALKVHAHLPRDAHHFGQCLPQQRRFVAIARRRHERRDHVAMAVAEGDDFVALHLLVPAEAEVVAALFRRRCGAVAVNDRRIEEAVLMKPRHRTGENGVDAAVVHPPPPDAINARVVSFQAAFAILVDRQLLPLAAQIHVLQNVVEYFVEAELRCRTAGAGGEVRQDKWLELREFQLRRNRLPALISSHLGPPENGTLPDSLAPAENPGPGRLTAKFDRLQKPATSCGLSGGGGAGVSQVLEVGTRQRWRSDGYPRGGANWSRSNQGRGNVTPLSIRHRPR